MATQEVQQDPIATIVNEISEASITKGVQTDEEELKEYLGDTLVPLLSYGLDELEKVRPPDPVLFLAHFLLRHNPKKTYK